MGGSSSKNQRNRGDEKNAPLPRSFSISSSSFRADGGSPKRTSWKSGSKETSATDMCKTYDMDSQCIRSPKLRSAREYNNVTGASSKERTNNALLELTDDLTHLKSSSRKSFPSPLSDSLSQLVQAKPRRRSCLHNGDGVENSHAMDMVREGRDLPHQISESVDGLSGLRLLLSPAATPLRSFASPSRIGTFSNTLLSSAGLVLNQTNETGGLVNAQTFQAIKVTSSRLEQMGDSEEVCSPLFDPSILETFEKAVRSLSNDSWTWQGSDATSSSCSRVECCASDTFSDAESLNHHKEEDCLFQQSQQSFCGKLHAEGTPFNAGTGELHRKRIGILKKKPSCRMTLLQSGSFFEKDNLDCFDAKCPPGCEDRIVLYFTSLRGIRKTYEDCWTVRLILKGFGVHVDERDVSMHSKFRQELTNTVGAVAIVPRLFVKGKYIGGVEEVKHLHELGILGNLLEGLPADLNSMCNVCGDIRFIPCTSCSGSCKLVVHKEVLRCPDCNENGLMMCPLCQK
ncbi:hypothetical protein KP509_02G070100 [Ceratopteris richardii]|uniref:Glutaredoxin domain-containing protein n=1 Tax=Ceratopteris richardii TaxID=49495 RepID=A0A8T2V703_CERRI|nr:hypothetical protein KP509_02G070100 [Ceratopteris richardii]KAH7444216.1 hypothetical protein KP509_02G070100 [Ceratopteris richardii]KAH7444217.1 hypothetical protein KP509_02G070100 [Ceratopteris richardii]